MIGTKKILVQENKKTVLIDADSLLYFSSYGSEEDLTLSENKLREKIYDILNIVETSYDIDEYFIFVKGKNNFRYKIFKDYKKSRPAKHPIIDDLVKYLVSEFNAIESHNAESDDYVFTFTEMKKYKNKCIVCSVDKDMLQIPGIHYDYQKNKYHIISEDEGNYNLGIQMIMGDAADCIPGLKGYGAVSAKKLLSIGMSSYQITKILIKEYKKVHGSNYKEEIRINYKLLKLRDMRKTFK